MSKFREKNKSIVFKTQGVVIRDIRCYQDEAHVLGKGSKGTIDFMQIWRLLISIN